MNSTHDNGKNDRSLHESLDKLGQDYARLDKDEPPELLDMAILNSAHRAVEKKPLWLKFGWLQGLTTAAVFVLALSLIINQREHQAATPGGMQADKLSRSAVASPAKGQSSAAQSGQFRQESKKAKDERMDQPVPAAAPPVNSSQEQVSGDAIRESRQSAADDAGQQFDSGSADTDTLILTKTIKAEEAEMQASKPADLAAEIATGNEFSKPAIIAEPPAPGAAARSKTDTRAEAQLQVIINMKQSGDEHWKTELKAFVESHPDYPLPDALKN